MDVISLGTTFEWAWSVVLGLVALPLISLVIQSKWSANAKRVTAVAVSAVLAVLYLLAKGFVDGVPPDVVATLVYWFVLFASIVVVSQSVYNLLRGPLSKWEALTDIARVPLAVPDESTESSAEDTEAASTAEDESGVPPDPGDPASEDDTEGNG